MSSSQRGGPGRRSARLAFEEDEDDGVAGAPAAKRTKVDEEAGATTGTKKSKKPAYNEDIDGFTFARAGKAKKGGATKGKSSSPTQSMAVEAENGTASTGVETSQKQQPARQTPARKHSPPKRRSARLSGEKTAHKPAEEQLPGPAPTTEQANGDIQAVQTAAPEERERGRARTPAAANELHVEKKRAPTKIALPFADTPVMARNKAMRKKSAETRRRSSSQMRGRRASSLIDSGASNALPHEQLPSTDFYKHINQELPEPRRMKQLLVWCGTRALPDRPSGSADDVNAALAARVIQDEILKDFSNKSDMSNWFNREEVAPTALIKRPNPRNVQNAKKLQELELEVERLKQEEATWATLLGDLSSSADTADQPLQESLDLTKLSTADQSNYKEQILGQDEQRKQQRQRLQAAVNPVEFKLDSLAEGVHKLAQFKRAADEQVDKILSESAQALDDRSKTSAASVGTDKVGVRELLRSLSRAA